MAYKIQVGDALLNGYVLVTGADMKAKNAAGTFQDVTGSNIFAQQDAAITEVARSTTGGSILVGDEIKIMSGTLAGGVQINRRALEIKKDNNNGQLRMYDNIPIGGGDNSSEMIKFGTEGGGQGVLTLKDRTNTNLTIDGTAGTLASKGTLEVGGTLVITTDLKIKDCTVLMEGTTTNINSTNAIFVNDEFQLAVNEAGAAVGANDALDMAGLIFGHDSAAFGGHILLDNAANGADRQFIFCKAGAANAAAALPINVSASYVVGAAAALTNVCSTVTTQAWTTDEDETALTTSHVGKTLTYTTAAAVTMGAFSAQNWVVGSCIRFKAAYNASDSSAVVISLADTTNDRFDSSAAAITLQSPDAAIELCFLGIVNAKKTWGIF